MGDRRQHQAGSGDALGRRHSIAVAGGDDGVVECVTAGDSAGARRLILAAIGGLDDGDSAVLIDWLRE